jgi:hypothetical protein
MAMAPFDDWGRDACPDDPTRAGTVPSFENQQKQAHIDLRVFICVATVCNER